MAPGCPDGISQQSFPICILSFCVPETGGRLNAETKKLYNKDNIQQLYIPSLSQKQSNMLLGRQVAWEDLMKKTISSFESINDYIATFPNNIREILQNLRTAIKESAPNAYEKISYQMPTFAQNGNLVHFAAFKNHIGFYPTSSGVEAFKKELSGYEYSKGAIRFPMNKPLPYELIKKIVVFRVNENLKESQTKLRKGR